MNNQSMSQAFNAWMDDFINNPEQFQSTEHSAMQHLNERLEGRAPSYGEACSAILAEYMKRFESA
ncbi:MAG: hypothetical protein E6X63_25800 [Pseudomonas aeruginosa]|uniref:hypothetical protein n=1 Tax=Pseudomonas aeruginosa TaxID=287 RepID=UPI00053D7B91|nr:hypothetical protein [Pseudomonas aeruginosa]MDU5684990.1 hypothetical protein [Kluyvera cryocrescens]EIU1671330.1 hypothetical protein [Pseudomonas aeruginosa]EIU7096861.1 hypothetical protein [Pseudomonas aeruginosa]EIU7116576.1 hypothetical protein [Pseudomonas aeruginosa]EMA4484672.1 hypothetical protein [Pseudomonas aeruginosa]